MAENEKIRLGISACLLGQKVRYDGGHKCDPFLVETLGQFVEWVPVCPEVECGLPTPREAMHLAGEPSAPRLVTIKTNVDLTEQMQKWAARRCKELDKESLCGFVFKSRSPSSGLERIKVYGEGGRVATTGVGLFAKAFKNHFPLLPLEDEGRLHDPALRENFIERVFCLKRYRDMVRSAGPLSGNAARNQLVEFHSDHKILFMAHSPAVLREMGGAVAHAKDLKPGNLFEKYEELMLRALGLPATPGKNANALQHMAGYLRPHLEAQEKQELGELVDRYRTGLIPLIVPITLLQHYVRKYGIEYLERQYYLNPHPIELKLRNHA